jgi:hypothetical protein
MHGGRRPVSQRMAFDQLCLHCSFSLGRISRHVVHFVVSHTVVLRNLQFRPVPSRHTLRRKLRLFDSSILQHPHKIQSVQPSPLTTPPFQFLSRLHSPKVRTPESSLKLLVFGCHSLRDSFFDFTRRSSWSPFELSMVEVAEFSVDETSKQVSALQQPSPKPQPTDRIRDRLTSQSTSPAPPH